MSRQASLKFVDTDWTKVAAGQSFKIQWDSARNGVYLNMVTKDDSTASPQRLVSDLSGTEWIWDVPPSIIDFRYLVNIGIKATPPSGNSPLFRIKDALPEVLPTAQESTATPLKSTSTVSTTATTVTNSSSQTKRFTIKPSLAMTSIPTNPSTMTTVTSSSSTSSALPSAMVLIHEQSLSPGGRGGIFAGTFCGFILIGLAFYFGQRYAKCNRKWPAPIGIGEAIPVEKLTGVGLKRADTITQIISSNGRIFQGNIAEMDGFTHNEVIELESRAVSVCDKGAPGGNSEQDTIHDKYFKRLISGNGNNYGSQIAYAEGITGAATREEAGQRIREEDIVGKK